MVATAFFWFLLLCEIGAIVLLLLALISKIRQISRLLASETVLPQAGQQPSPAAPEAARPQDVELSPT